MLKFLLGFSAGFASAGLIAVVIGLANVNPTTSKPSFAETSPTVAVEPSPSVAESTEPSAAPKKMYKFKTLEITILGAKLTPQGVAVPMEVKNLSSNEVYFHPDLGSAVLGDRQFNAIGNKTVGDSFGKIQPNVVKRSTIYFSAPEGQTISNTSTIQSIRLALGKANDYDAGIVEPIEIELKRIK